MEDFIATWAMFSAAIAIIGFVMMFGAGAILIWESLRPSVVQLIRWVRG